MKLQLRDYQQAAVDAIYTHFGKSDENALIVIPTAGGKTPVLASFLDGVFKQWPDSKVLCLVHVKELLSQAHKTLKAIWPAAPSSIYSAGLGQKNLRGDIVFATVQSIFKKAFALQRIDLVIIDEVDLVPLDGEGMYRKILDDLKSINPHVKVIGLTATPWRMNDGLITEGKGRLFSSIAYEVEINTLIKGGWICPPIAKTMDTQIDTSSVAVRGGEFVAGALEKAADKDEITKAAVAEIIALGADRVSWLVFASGVEHANHIRDEFKAHDITCEAVTGKTGKEDRERWIADYQARRIKCLVNVSVLTVGFDSPATDLLAILRPTKSSRLWLQILGRGFRLSPATNKTDFMVLDYTSNARDFGPIDLLTPKSKFKSGKSEEAPKRICPECEAEIIISCRQCLACGYEFPEPEPPQSKISHTADNAPLLASQIIPQWLPVTGVRYAKHEKPDKPPSMRVDYWCGLVKHSEWICVQHVGYARQKACQWWMRRARGIPIPATVDEALAETSNLMAPTEIQIKSAGKYIEIVSARFE